MKTHPCGQRKLPFIATLLVTLLAGTLALIPAISDPRSIWNARYDNVGLSPWPLKAGATPQQLGQFEPLNVYSSQDKTHNQRTVLLYDFSDTDPVAFRTAWDFQKRLREDHLTQMKPGGKGLQSQLSYLQDPSVTTIPTSGTDALILLQHKPVYTLGTGSDPSFINAPQSETLSRGESAIDIVRIERGGEVTCHTPGQIVAYPIIDLRGYRQDVHWYVRALEEVILKALQLAGVEGATREENLTGIFVQGKKVAALGVKIRRWVTMHGLSINIERRSLEDFAGIVPCGLVGKEVGCVNDFLDEDLTVSEFALFVKQAFQEVFQVKLAVAQKYDCLDLER